MPARDIYHNAVIKAMQKQGWTITDDPLNLKWGARDVYVDLGIKQLFAAENREQKIAVEIKSFIGVSPVTDLENALGQYILYFDILQRLDPERKLYLAIRQQTFEGIFAEPIGQILIENKRLSLLIFDSTKEEIIQWIH